jgi:hypothetical protein
MNAPAKRTIGQAIDQVISALADLEDREKQTVISTVCGYLGLIDSRGASPFPVTAAPGPQHAPNESRFQVTGPAPAQAPAARGIDIRAFKEDKQPESARQMACVVAFYLMELAPDAERKETVSAGDVEKYFKQANYKLPKQLEQLLIDCKKAGYFESISRGEYKLTRVGYNLVAHSLPKG